VSITSCAIITTIANQESQDTWLKGDPKLEALGSLLTPFPAARMKSHAVSYDVNHTTTDHEYSVRPVDPISELLPACSRFSAARSKNPMSGGLPHSEKPFVGQMREQVFCVTVAIDEFSWFAIL